MSIGELTAIGAFCISAIMMIYIIAMPSPKETNARLGKVEVEMEGLRQLLRGTIKTVDRLARVIDNYLENRGNGNGRGDHR